MGRMTCALLTTKNPIHPTSSSTENKDVPEEVCKQAKGRGFEGCEKCEKIVDKKDIME